MSFKKAVKEKLKARLAIEGPSGSGKSMSALLIARGLVGTGTIAMIDTEKDSGKLYADTTPFDHCSLEEPYSPERYIALIGQAKGYDCLIIDSITHEWAGAGGILEIHDKMPGNSYTNWAKVNPRHDAFLNAILNFPGHIIVTCRSKQAYVLEANDKGKQEPKKVGMAPQQRDGIEYEFTAVLKMDRSHQAEGSKDRTGLFPVGEWFQPTVAIGADLADWLGSGIEPVVVQRPPVATPPAQPQHPTTLQDWKDEAATKKTIETLLSWRGVIGTQVKATLNAAEQKLLFDHLNSHQKKLEAGPTVDCPDNPGAYVPESYCQECPKREGCPMVTA